MRISKRKAVRERERERGRDRQTDRQTDREKHRHTDRQRDRETDREKHRHTDRQRDRQTDREKHKEKQTDRQTERQRLTEDKAGDGSSEETAGTQQQGVVQGELSLGDPPHHHGKHGRQEPHHCRLGLKTRSTALPPNMQKRGAAQWAVSVSAQDGIVVHGPQRPIHAPPHLSAVSPRLPSKHCQYLPWRVECRLLPFSTPLSFRRSML